MLPLLRAGHIHRVGREDLVGLLEERVQRLRRPFPVRGRRLRGEHLRALLVGVRVRDVRSETVAPEDERGAVLRTRTEQDAHAASEVHSVEDLRELLRALLDPPRAPVRDPHRGIHRREVPAECDVPLFHGDADPRRLERTSPGVHLHGVVPEEREMARVAPGPDAGGDRIHEARDTVRREPIEGLLSARLEGRLATELRDRPVPEAVENQEQDLPPVHRSRHPAGRRYGFPMACATTRDGR